MRITNLRGQNNFMLAVKENKRMYNTAAKIIITNNNEIKQTNYSGKYTIINQGKGTPKSNKITNKQYI